MEPNPTNSGPVLETICLPCGRSLGSEPLPASLVPPPGKDPPRRWGVCGVCESVAERLWIIDREIARHNQPLDAAVKAGDLPRKGTPP